MIREMAAKSCGAQIKILSSREQERLLQDCIVTIAGSLANKQDAACIILEKIQEFQNSDKIDNEKEKTGKIPRKDSRERSSHKVRRADPHSRSQSRHRSPPSVKSRSSSQSSKDRRRRRDRTQNRRTCISSFRLRRPD